MSTYYLFVLQQPQCFDSTIVRAAQAFDSGLPPVIHADSVKRNGVDPQVVAL